MIARANGQVKHIPFGLNLPKSHKNIVGEKWWSQNQEVLEQKSKLEDKPIEEPTIDIF